MPPISLIFLVASSLVTFSMNCIRVHRILFPDHLLHLHLEDSSYPSSYSSLFTIYTVAVKFPTALFQLHNLSSTINSSRLQTSAEGQVLSIMSICISLLTMKEESRKSQNSERFLEIVVSSIPATSSRVAAT